MTGTGSYDTLLLTGTGSDFTPLLEICGPGRRNHKTSQDLTGCG